MSAQWPRVKAWLVSTMPQLSGWSGVEVNNGAPTTADSPTRYATVGYVHGTNDAGTYQTTRADDGFRWTETGSINSQLVCGSGDVDSSVLTDEAFALADALEAHVRGDRTLGGTLSLDSQVDFQVTIQQSEQGTASALILTVSYFTVT